MLFVVTTVVMLGSVSRHENVAGVHNTFAQQMLFKDFFSKILQSMTGSICSNVCSKAMCKSISM